ncbi:MAG: tyrosine-type recombinase/integrase [Haliea sp.]|jgi:integrase|nr:tyrosine-type recombinase/integrase [Haliea sp.]
MGRKKSPGLFKRGRIWWIDKRIKGYGRVAESCGTTKLAEAEEYLAFRLNEVRSAMVYGIRPTRTFQQAAIKFLEDNQHKKLFERYVYAFERVMPYIGDLRLDRIHNDTLASYRRARRADGVSAGTINKELSCVRRVLNLAARVWRHDNGMAWLDAPPLIEMEQGNIRRPYPLSWEEQDLLFRELPAHLQRIALYKVNTGCRTQEVLQLRWNWEVQVPELGTSVFILPVLDEFQTKNGQERVVVLNSIARRVVDEQRGKHPEFVFTYRGRPTKSIHNWGWKLARERAKLPQVRVHDLRHTFGHRLRAAGVSYEDRQDLLGHKSDRITTHYSAPDVARLIEAAEKVCVRRPNTVLRIAAPTNLPQFEKSGEAVKEGRA